MINKSLASVLIISLSLPYILFGTTVAHAQTAALDVMSECGIGAVTDLLGSVIGKVANVIKGAISGAINFLTGGLLGGVTEDKNTVTVKSAPTLENVGIKTCLQAIKEVAFRIALANLKKRLLDRLVDDTIAWIQDENHPQFSTDIWADFRNARDAAIGDTLRDIGLGNLCYGGLINRARIQLELQTPVFSQQVSCTLGQVISNINEFRNNFNAGGWIGYYEIFKPQNNPWGLEILTNNEIDKRSATNQQVAQTTMTAGGLYKNTEQCLEWHLLAREYEGGPITDMGHKPVNGQFNYPDPASSPPVPEDVINQFPAAYYECSQKQITTPASTKGAVAASALTADYQYIISADDLSTYIAAIFDAAVNRLIKEGAKGLKGMTQSQSATGAAPTPYGTSARDQVYRGYGNQFQSATDLRKQLAQNILTLISSTTADLVDVTGEIGVVLPLVQDLIATTTLVTSCQVTRIGQVCASTSSTLINAGAFQTELTNDQTNLSALPQQLRDAQVEAQQAAAGTSNLTEGQLQILLSSISSAWSDLLILKARLLQLQTGVSQQAQVQYQEYQRCQTVGGYSCPL